MVPAFTPYVPQRGDGVNQGETVVSRVSAMTDANGRRAAGRGRHGCSGEALGGRGTHAET